MKHVFIGGAWPYANGPLHVGHVAALLPGDVLARYHRLRGNRVLYVSGSDCHGTPITLRAEQEGVSPEVITNRNHARFLRCFADLGFSYDRYSRTDDGWHKVMVETFFRKLVDNGAVAPRTVEQVYCPHCERFLPDRFIEGDCPTCGGHARGDQCDDCGALIEPLELRNPVCRVCGGTPKVASTRHLFLTLSAFQARLEQYAKKQTGWNQNAVHLTDRFLKEGLRDRAVTRDLSWGVDVPIQGFEGKKLYVWIDAVLGYLSASMLWSEQTGADWEDFWLDDREDIVSYYVHGKDNIPFHTIILPALILGVGSFYGANLHLPDRIVSSEHVTLEGQKLSTSTGWAVWADDLLERYPADALRYFLIANAPEKRDADFSFSAFLHSHNAELLGAYGNFVNRTLQFVVRYLDGVVPAGTLDAGVAEDVRATYDRVAALLETGACKAALEEAFALVRRANRWYDARQPWATRESDARHCADTMVTCVAIVQNLCNLLEPFLPFSCERVRGFFDAAWAKGWEIVPPAVGARLAGVEPLYPRYEKGRAERELARLRGEAVALAEDCAG